MRQLGNRRCIGLVWPKIVIRCSFCKMMQLTFLISFIISFGSIALVVFILHVKRSDLGLIPSGSRVSPDRDLRKTWLQLRNKNSWRQWHPYQAWSQGKWFGGEESTMSKEYIFFFKIKRTVCNKLVKQRDSQNKREIKFKKKKKTHTHTLTQQRKTTKKN